MSRWRSQLTGDKRHEALANIRNVRDPLAIEAIGRLLKIERDCRMRFIYVELLGQIGDNEALVALVGLALSDRDQEVFYACLDELSKHNTPPLVRQFVKALDSPKNDQVNRAAIALSSLGDRSAIPPLIEALVTTHQTVLPGNEMMTNTFVRDGGGLLSGDSFSTGPKAPQSDHTNGDESGSSQSTRQVDSRQLWLRAASVAKLVCCSATTTTNTNG